MSDKPFAIVGVNSDPDLEMIQETVKEKNLPWRSFWNGERGTKGPISMKWGIQGWPTTFLIDAKGTIRFKNLRGEELDKAIESLMGEIDIDVSLSGVDHERNGASD